jgi:hypothetical protein
MGTIPSVEHMPSLRILFPFYNQTLTTNVAFTVSVNVTNLETSNRANIRNNFLGAPQQIGSTGNILGHVLLIIEKIGTLEDSGPLDPTKFAFSNSLTGSSGGGLLTASVSTGLSAGFYRLTVRALTTNYHSVIVPVVPHGALIDATYVRFPCFSYCQLIEIQITVSDDGKTPPDTGGFTGEASPSTILSPSSPPFDSQIETSLSLDPSVIVRAFKSGDADSSVAGTDSILTLSED